MSRRRNKANNRGNTPGATTKPLNPMFDAMTQPPQPRQPATRYGSGGNFEIGDAPGNKRGPQNSYGTRAQVTTPPAPPRVGPPAQGGTNPKYPGQPDWDQQFSQYSNQRPDGGPPPYVRDIDIDANWFTPMQPVWPFGPPYVNYPREWDYPVGINLEYLPKRYELMSMLRTMAESWGILAAIIQNKIDLITKTPYSFEVQNASNPSNKWTQLLDQAFYKPDRKNHFQTWQRRLLYDMYTIDSASLYNWKAANGMPYALEVLDGQSIKPIVDDAGRRPDWPQPAYQQIIKGLPMENFDESELIYAPMRPRSYLPIYGYSAVEQCFLEITQGIRRTIYQTSFWTEGSMPDMVFSVPPEWTPLQIAQYQGFFDALMAGNPHLKSKVRFVPGGMKPFYLKGGAAETLKSDWDEWVTRLICFVFGVSPQPFIREMTRATAEVANEKAKEAGEVPDLRWFKFNIMDPIIKEWFGFDDISFVYKTEADTDPSEQQTTLTGYVNSGIMLRDEAREQLGLSPYPDGSGSVPTVTAASPLQTLEPQETPPPQDPNLQAQAQIENAKAKQANPNAAGPGAGQAKPASNAKPKPNAKKPVSTKPGATTSTTPGTGSTGTSTRHAVDGDSLDGNEQAIEKRLDEALVPPLETAIHERLLTMAEQAEAAAERWLRRNRQLATRR